MPLSHSPVLRPTPRKLKRSTTQPMRVNALAPWNTTLVCMVPPWVGSGCAKTTTARGGADGASTSTSSRPAGPAISFTGSANSPPGNDVWGVLLDEAPDHGRELVGPG